MQAVSGGVVMEAGCGAECLLYTEVVMYSACCAWRLCLHEACQEMVLKMHEAHRAQATILCMALVLNGTVCETSWLCN